MQVVLPVSESVSVAQVHEERQGAGPDCLLCFSLWRDPGWNVGGRLLHVEEELARQLMSLMFETFDQ
jgi:hypothetical protein